MSLLYVNNAGTSWPKPRAVLSAVDRALRCPPGELAKDVESAEATVRAALSLPDSGTLLFTPGCTAALRAAIEDLPWAPGDRVVTSALEHHAVAGPVQRLGRDRGVVHEVSPYAPGRPFDLDWLRKVLREGAVRLVAFSAASNVTGEILPAAEIAELCRESGTLCLMDAAQTVGVLDVDARALGVDMLCFAGHKGPLGPQGIGALWMAEHVAFACPSAVCAGGDGRPAKGRPGYCDVGGINLGGVLGVAAGLSWLADRPSAFGTARRAAERLRDALRARPNVTVFGGDGERTATVSFVVEGLPLTAAEAFFSQRGVVLRAGAHCAPEAVETIGAREGTLRVSFGVFNEDRDVERIVDAVDECVSSPGA